MQVEFTVDGKPQGKARPRVTKSGHAYTPRSTMLYEDHVRAEYARQTNSYRFADDTLLCLQIWAFMPIPKSTSKAKRKQMLEEWSIRPAKRPDLDNVLKAIADALNGVAYADDAQIVDMRASRWYSDVPRVDVHITEMGASKG